MNEDQAPKRHVVGELRGAPSARYKGKGEDGWHIVERFTPEGSYDLYTGHWTAWGARRAVRAYEQKGIIKGVVL